MRSPWRWERRRTKPLFGGVKGATRQIPLGPKEKKEGLKGPNFNFETFLFEFYPEQGRGVQVQVPLVPPVRSFVQTGTRIRLVVMTRIQSGLLTLPIKRSPLQVKRPFPLTSDKAAFAFCWCHPTKDLVKPEGWSQGILWPSAISTRTHLNWSSEVVVVGNDYSPE